jgi:general secretion pathway protein B
VPLLQEMPFEFQRTVPNVRIDALVYSEDAGGRMVFIGNHKYMEGQQVEGNLRLDKITREGVVLSYQGQQFLLRP